MSKFVPMKSTVRDIKRQFFAMRNGIIADRMRSLGAPYKIIFGLNLPQVAEIAARFEPSEELASFLWNNNTTRESLLIAPMLFPRSELTADKARAMIETAPTTEAVDILCHRLLRHLPDAIPFAVSLAGSSREMTRYAALRLLINLFPASAEAVGDVARRELAEGGSTLTAAPARMILDEIEFLNESDD